MLVFPQPAVPQYLCHFPILPFNPLAFQQLRRKALILKKTHTLTHVPPKPRKYIQSGVFQ